MSRRKFVELSRKKDYYDFLEFSFHKLFLTVFKSCFRFKDTVKVDWSFVCHLDASMLYKQSPGRVL